IALKRRADDERRTRMANFPYIKTLADFDWGFQPSVPRGLVEQLATLEFIDRGAQRRPASNDIDPPAVNTSLMDLGSRDAFD
ncbi:ATP-binding protein, partial [Chryseobacterium gambrini]|uniref:ATP-binding protein n=1 Tax=Chryseobacterium gambrini TaxID=373672 RepID=UPI0025B4B228